MNIEDLVPPLELCKQIPENEFVSCYAYWAEEWNINQNTLDGEEFETMISVVSDVTFIKTEQMPTQEIVEKFKSKRTRFVKDFYPAPTLQEIIENGDPVYELTVKHKPGANQSMAENALKAWLELKNKQPEFTEDCFCECCGRRIASGTYCSNCEDQEW